MRPQLKALALSILVIFAPIKAALITVMVLSLVDLLLGILGARSKGLPITSRGLRRTISKVAVYELVVILGFLVETYLTGDAVPIVKVLAGMIGITELKSVLENLEALTGIPLLTLLIDRLTNIEKK
jgi:hypothetical protein